MDAEVRFHMDAYAADLMRGSNLSREEAQRRARNAFGNVEKHKEDARRSLGLRLWDDGYGDVRYTLRGLRRSPGFSVVAVCSLALAMGTAAAVGVNPQRAVRQDESL